MNEEISIINNGIGIYPDSLNSLGINQYGAFNPNLFGNRFSYLAADVEYLHSGNSFTSGGYNTRDIIVRCQITTGNDVTTGQIVWESGGSSTGCGLGIQNGVLKVYGGSTNTEYVNTYAVNTNTTYDIAVAYDLTNDEVRLYVAPNNRVITINDLVDTDEFLQSNLAGTDATGVGAKGGSSTKLPYGADFLGTVTDGKIYLYATNDITTIYG